MVSLPLEPLGLLTLPEAQEDFQLAENNGNVSEEPRKTERAGKKSSGRGTRTLWKWFSVYIDYCSSSIVVPVGKVGLLDTAFV